MSRSAYDLSSRRLTREETANSASKTREHKVNIKLSALQEDVTRLEEENRQLLACVADLQNRVARLEQLHAEP